MKADHLCGQAVTIIDPHSPHYGAVVVVKAIQLGIAQHPSTLLVSGRTCGEFEVQLQDVTTMAKRKLSPQTEFFI